MRKLNFRNFFKELLFEVASLALSLLASFDLFTPFLLALRRSVVVQRLRLKSLLELSCSFSDL